MRLEREHGGILIMTLVWVIMFISIFIALTSLTTRSYHQAVLQSHDELAFQIAEAGLNYARWRLAHDNDNFLPETREVQDQLAGVLGSYTLFFEAPDPGSTVVLITASGQTASQPNRTVRLRARYGIPSLARYAAITNSDVYYTSQISGPVHSNGGIRMDGQSDSLMTSAKETYTCQPVHGCNPAQTKPGIWGIGENNDLWEFPVAPVDYNALTVDLLDIKNAAQSLGTYYGPSGVFGYHIIFNNNNTYTIYRVTQKGPNVNSSYGGMSEFSSYDIGQQVLLETKAVPQNGAIFTEDTMWVKGEVQGRVTVAAGRFPDVPATNADVILNGDITYGGVKDGSRVFGVIAQRNVLIPWSGAEDNLELNGAFIAQKGFFGRRYYANSGATRAHAIKTRIERYGMAGSNLIPALAYSSGGTIVSGYRQRELTYDPHLLYGPPPYFPTSGEYEFISWEELSSGEE